MYKKEKTEIPGWS